MNISEIMKKSFLMKNRSQVNIFVGNELPMHFTMFFHSTKYKYVYSSKTEGAYFCLDGTRKPIEHHGKINIAELQMIFRRFFGV